MKSIKMFGLAALAALMAMAFAGASSAMAETTKLCSSDPVAADAPISCSAVTHVHETTLAGAKGKLLTSIVNVECDVLFLGDTVGEEGNPLVIEGNFTYTNCGSCTVEEVGGGVEIKVLKESHETAKVTGEGEVHVNCSGLNCTYNGEGLVGTGKGPLLSSETNGSVVITEQVAKKVSGLFCPSTSKLDITTTPLSATYLVSAWLGFCVDTEHTTGLYVDSECTKKASVPHTGLYTLVYAWRGWGLVGDKRCYHTLSHEGLWKTYRLSGLGCLDDGTLYAELYENGIITKVE
jgi:hypothetical protein